MSTILGAMTEDERQNLLRAIAEARVGAITKHSAT